MSWGFAVGFLAGVLSVSGVYRSRWFARQRRDVWQFRETESRRAMLAAIDKGDHAAEVAAERKLTLAMIRRRRWARRA